MDPIPASGTGESIGYRRKDVLICVLIVLATIIAYSSVGSFEFVSFDDSLYPQNPQVRQGLTWDGITWAFTTGDWGNWNPIVWLTYMADIQIFGLQPASMHATNLGFHIGAALLLFAFLRRATGSSWRSGLVTFIFAVHPLHVESVAWVSERKDVTYAFFWFLTSWCWVRYAEKTTWWRYAVALGAFCLGLMSKPMIVTLPFVLLLVDLWPLRRAWSWWLILEKLPFLALAAGDAALTYQIQSNAGYVGQPDFYPIGTKIGNALMTWLIYLEKALVPVNLPFWYPYPKHTPEWQVIGAGCVIAGIFYAAIRYARRAPYLAVGWFWYFGTLIPVIGLVQVGTQSRADRYTYIPLVGFSIIVAWAAADIVKRWPRTRVWVVSVLACACLALVPDTWLQSQYWKNSETLYTHGLKVSTGNVVAYHNLGLLYRDTPGRAPEALAVFDDELRFDPDWADGHRDRAGVLWVLGRAAEAEAEYRTAILLQPRDPVSRLNFGSMLDVEGRYREALDQYDEALKLGGQELAKARYEKGRTLVSLKRYPEAIRYFELSIAQNPNIPEVHNARGSAMCDMGKCAEAILDFDNAIRLNAGDQEAYRNRGVALAKAGRLAEAAESFEKAIQLLPDDAVAHNMLGFVLMQTPGKTIEAEEHLRKAILLNPGMPQPHENLAELLARNPAELTEAIREAESAVRLRPSRSNIDLLQKLRRSAPTRT